ncbi:hypothetical protein [Quadrisphaera sp. INWT6]|uniref:hypothetical protein n=1 Tax=Quadrisphaera sp. INWT6 TaxID=2596917 RepID=UPI001892793B|nr:hypothetical protein [Quadrisphaera sp. INWT6]MBF5081421.1 hypothetical protein [Quadrisphaera sp. INWT6]
MSEHPGWTAPGSPGGQPPEPAQGPQPPAPAQSGWGQAPHPGGGSWAARAPRPGIIPLRPLSLGELWDGAFRAVRTNPGPLLGTAAVVVVITTVISSLVQVVALDGFEASLTELESDPTATPDQVFGSLSAGLPGLLGGSLLSAVLTLVAVAALTGVVTTSVSTAVLGRRTPGRELWAKVRGRLGPLVGVSLLASLIPSLAAFLLFVPGAALLVGGAVNGSDGALVGGGALLLLGALAAVVVGLFLTVRLFMAPAVLVLEGQGVGASLKRAWALSRRGFWRLLGIYLLTALCIGIVAAVVATPFSFAGGAIGVAVGVDSPMYLPVTLVLSGIGTVLASTVLYPLQAAVVALQYVDQRMRLEGLDVDLARAAAR